MKEKIFTIGQISKEAEVSIETIRYYERLKLLPAPKRTPSGYRQYCENCIARLRFIKNAKELGFSLKEISELLALRIKPRTTCANVKEKTDKKITDIDEKIKRLQAIKKALKKLSARCSKGKAPLSDCPILAEFDTKKL